jgi:hypothetical protein
MALLCGGCEAKRDADDQAEEAELERARRLADMRERI